MRKGIKIMDIPSYSEAVKTWKEFEKYLVESRYSVRDENGNPIEHSYDDVAIRVSKWLISDSVLGNLPVPILEYIKENNLIEVIYGYITEKLVVPATPILMNSGSKTKRLGYFSCFPLGYVDDSIEDIFGKVKLMKDIYVRAGGAGINISKLRPKGTLVDNNQGYASGPVSFLQLYDAVAGTVSQGGRRRGALMVDCSVDNPDWKEFIKCKSDNRYSYQNMNISLDIEDKLDSEVVDLVAESIWNCGDPGLIFIRNAYAGTPIPKELEPRMVNPCITGDSLLYVAGKGPVSIKELADNGKDVPLYSYDKTDKKIKVSIGHHPRKTREKVEVYKVKLDDGSFYRGTADHTIPLLDGSEKKLINLIEGDSLVPFWLVTDSLGDNYVDGIYEYHLIAEAKYGDITGMDIHHKDLNHYNNDWDNIEVLTQHEHRSLHGSLLVGNKNPMYNHQYTPETLDKFKSAWENRKKSPEYEVLTRNASERMRLYNSKRAQQTSVFENHKVVSVELDGIEDVYNITVDKYHNYVVVTNLKGTRKRHKIKEGITGVVINNCAEYMSVAMTACNLLSINLPEIIRRNKISDPSGKSLFKSIEKASMVATLIGNIILCQSEGYPSEEIRKNSQEYKPVGIGILGLHGGMIIEGLDYASKEGLEFAERCQAAMALGSMLQSAKLMMINPILVPCRKDWMLEHISYCYSRSAGLDKSDISTIKDVIKTHGSLYNMVTTVQAPTGSISQLVNSSTNGIEPLYSLSTTRKVKDIIKGWIEFKIYPLEIYTQDGTLKDISHLTESISHNISAEDQMIMLSKLQKMCHTSISKTINVPESTTVDDIKEIIRRAYDVHNLKCITVYRDHSKEDQILSVEAEEKIDLSEEDDFPDVRPGITYTIHGPRDCHLKINQIHGIPREVFITSGKNGTMLSGLLEMIGRTISIALRSNPKLLKRLAQSWHEIDTGTSHHVQGRMYKSIPDAMSGIIMENYINRKTIVEVRVEGEEVIEEEKRVVVVHKEESKLNICPECGNLSIYRNGSCMACKICTYTSC